MGTQILIYWGYRMSTYVMSDLHGCFSAFQKMLDQINFKDSDRMIIAGDIVDRGPENLRMLRWLSERPDNIELIMGNHDYAFVQYVDLIVKSYEEMENSEGETEELNPQSPAAPGNAGQLDEKAIEKKKIDAAYKYARKLMWTFDYYGTIYELLRRHKLNPRDLIEFADQLRNLPYMKEIFIGGKDYIVVHAGYVEDPTRALNYGYSLPEEFFMSAREDGLTVGGKENATIIFGHTPTIVDSMCFYNHGKVYKYYDDKRNCTFYDIDCGWVFHNRNAESHLACIRLDDEKIFYLE